MPKITESTDQIDFLTFGKNVREQRLLRGWSLEMLAKRAGVAPQTVLRIEHGAPSTPSKRAALAAALDTILSRLETPRESIRDDVAIHMRSNDRWTSLIDRRTQVPEDDGERIQTPEERRRLGRLGFVTQFVKVLLCRLPRGNVVSGILELHGPLLPSRYLGGEVFAYALKGDSELHLGDECFPLNEGEATTIDCTKPFFFAPREPQREGFEPTLVLYVRLDEIVPISRRKPKRGTAVEGRVQEWVESGFVSDTDQN